MFEFKGTGNKETPAIVTVDSAKNFKFIHKKGENVKLVFKIIKSCEMSKTASFFV